MKRPRIAAVVTEYRRYSHAQHIVDRFLMGYGNNGRHHRPEMDVVSLYTDQTPDGELASERAKAFPQMKIYPTIAEALTRGGEKLAVDGVLLIGEHGRYPTNEKGQRLYPRYEFFQKIVEVFRNSGRSVPVFNDKHLSWNWDWAREMVDTAKELEFGFMAGSSLPVTRRMPAIDLPFGAEVEEAICVAVGGVDGYDIHALEAIQSMVERRRGGEVGVVEMRAVADDAVWDAMRAGSWDQGGWDPELFHACLCRSQSLTPAKPGFNHVLPTAEQIPALVKKPNRPICYRYRHGDGLKVTMLLLEGLVHDFSFAARLKRGREIFSTMVHLPPREVCNFFSPLTHHVEQLFLTGVSPIPIERNLLTTGVTAAGVESLWLGRKRIDTPHLNVAYKPRRESTFWNW
ncbi:MAG: hypothetical protein QF805_24270 [Pirellulaceae bacterium]|nr:hypothetical protein [Pirellulaceae bacterium]